jgi:Golgi SNAP receptor complex protein 1
MSMDNFDALRHEATKLERVLEDKGTQYQQLAHRITSQPESSNNLTIENGATNFKKLTDEQQESNLASDINRTISLMSDLINTKMAPLAESTNNAQHSLVVKRYREILFDCTADFKKMSAAVSRRREAQELFHGVGGTQINAIDEENNVTKGMDPAMEQLLRERNAIGNSLKSATSVLGQASEIHSELRAQGNSLRNMSGKMNKVMGKIPGLNNLMDAITKRRNRDDRIVSYVGAACILFILWYVFVA